jgi:hypothetical protein
VVGEESGWVIHPARLPVKLDGRLGEWNLAPGAIGELAWDNDALYLAVDARDAHPIFSDDRSRDFSGSDRVVLLVATGAGASAETGKQLGEDDFAFVLAPDSLYHRPLKTIYGFGGYNHVEFDLRLVTVAAQVGASRYQLEARIPWSALKVTPAAGQQLSVSVLRFDVGPDGSVQVTDLWGRPARTPVGRHLLVRATLGAQ